MRKIVIALFLVVLMASPAFALFENGGFESGDFTGWTIVQGYNGLNTSAPTFVPGDSTALGYHDVSTWYAPKVIQNGVPGTDLYHYPYLPGVYNGNKMAVLNDAYGYFDATRISQTDTVDAADVAAGGVLSVNWGAVLDDPQHDVANQPAFQIQILKNGSQISNFFATATDAAQVGSGWNKLGIYDYSDDYLWYKAGQFQLLMNNFNLDDSVKVELTIYDCGYGGHGAYAFLDGIQSGEPPPPPPGVPEPATLLLLGFGLAGLATLRKKF